MTVSHQNELGQPIGSPVVNWKSPAPPPRGAMHGSYCRVEPLDPTRHAQDLFAANRGDTTNVGWTYLPYGPFADIMEYVGWMQTSCLGDDPLFFAVIDPQSGKAVGVASYLRIDPKNGTIEVGHIKFSPFIQRTRIATETMFQMMKRVFDLGYRRYEWKCDALNAPSRAAALRLGFTFEGVFRQASVYKGRNRDTAWFSVIDVEWPALHAAFTRWLAPQNFDQTGKQRRSLSDLTAEIRGDDLRSAR